MSKHMPVEIMGNEMMEEMVADIRKKLDRRPSDGPRFDAYRHLKTAILLIGPASNFVQH